MEPVSPRLSRERLLAIVAHLRKPQSELSLDQFNFSCIVNGEVGCGTNGCAMGEYPAIWPNDFEYRRSGFNSNFLINVCRIGDNRLVGGGNADWLGIPHDHETVLFYPKALVDSYNRALLHEYPELYEAGVRYLPGDASKGAVADNIQAYVDGFLAPDMLDDDE